MARPAHRLIMSIKPRVRVTAVVKHAIQNQTHTLFLRVFTQAQQRLIAAKLNVNVAIVCGIVLMHAWRFKHRVKVQRRHAQFLQIRQLFADAVQIAAVERGPPRLRGQRFIPFFQNNVVSCGVVVIDLILLCGARFATRKAVRENLVKDLIVNPLRASVRAIDGKLLQPRRRKTAKSLRGKPQLAVVPQQLKAIAATRLAAAQVDIRPPRRHTRLRLTTLLVHF